MPMANANPIAIFATRAFFALSFFSALPIRPQPTARPAFEVASIRPSNPSPGPNDRSAFGLHGRFTATGVSLTVLAEIAYGVKDYQISAGPRWIQSDRYDIAAKAGEDTSDDQFKLMLQTLLEDRFKLQFHREMKDLSVYALVAAKNGPKLKKSADGTPYSRRVNASGWTVSNLDMAGLAARLSRELGRPVVDMTGLTGGYDFTLEWTRERATAASAAESDAPSLFTAVQEQLGLKLEPRKQPVETLVIDRVEKPSEN